MRGNGERIGPQNLPTSSIAGGIWNLLNQQRAQQRGAWPSATPAVTTDPYFMYVPLLLNTTSTNAQQNNTFLDSSSNAFTITRNGTPTQGAFTPYQPSGYWSGYFDGSTAYLSNSTSGLITSASTYTVEGWIYVSSYPGSGLGAGIIGTADQSSSPVGFNIQIQSAGKLQWGEAWFTSIVTSSSSVPLNQWTHVAFVKSSSSASGAKIYINGALDVTGTLPNSTYATSSFVVGRTYTATNGSYWNGYISNLRMVNGVAVYTGAFTPPTTPLASTQSAGTNISAITGTATSLLTLQDNRFIDNSSNVRVLTANGTPKVQAFQPFAPAASYSAATYGGSGYFNGTSDYLSVASNAAFAFGTGDFTVEAWVYLTTNIANATGGYLTDFRGGSTNNFALGFIGDSGVTKMYEYVGSGPVSGTGTATVTLNNWNHVAWVRSGNTVTMYLNGTSNGSITSSYSQGSTSVTICSRYTGATEFINCYISNLRIVKGTAIYTANFTPPTLAPLQTSGAASAASYPSTTNVNTSFGASSTALLTNFTNAGIYDAAWQNNALTVGDAQASTTQYKWSPTSMKFDGTGDYLTMPATPQWIMSGDWTLEAWIYPTSVSGVQVIINTRNLTSNPSPVLYLNGTNLVIDTGAAPVISAGTISSNSWQYVAATRSGNSWKLFINGSQVGSTTTNTTTYSTAYGCVIGSSHVNEYFNGYIQDVRVTKGVARTITTPTAAFPTR